MIFLFSIFQISQSISSALLTSSNSGFTIIHLRYKKSVKISLVDRMAVIPDGDSNTFGFSVKFYENDLNPLSYNNFPSGSLTITGYELTLFSNAATSEETISVPLWLIPKALCNGTNALIIAEHHLLLEAKSSKFRGNVCLFSQTEFHSAKVEAILKSKDQTSLVAFYENNNRLDSNQETDIDEPVKTCTNGVKCRTHHLNPFFIVIKPKSQKPIKFNLDYEVRAPKNSIVHCQLNTIVRITPQGPKKSVAVFEGSKIKCESRANDMLIIYKYIGILVVLTLAIAIILQCTGTVDIGEILCPDEEKKRFENLKKDPYASQIDQTPENLTSQPKFDSIDKDN